MCQRTSAEKCGLGGAIKGKVEPKGANDWRGRGGQEGLASTFGAEALPPVARLVDQCGWRLIATVDTRPKEGMVAVNTLN